jgi:C1A family cysteine protease
VPRGASESHISGLLSPIIEVSAMAFSRGCVLPPDLAARVDAATTRTGAHHRTLSTVTQASYDARTAGHVTPIKNQSACGDCWNFAGTGCAEMASIVAGTGSAATTNWAEQSVLDCGTNGGCHGDWIETALKQARDSGLANTSDYPYTGGVGPCKNVPHPNIIVDYGYAGTTAGVASVQDIKKAILTYGLVAVGVSADTAFESYTGGVFDGSGATAIDHAVILVGWQDGGSHPGGGYWVLRNSWGTGWGEQGYMRIAYGANQVGYGAMWAMCMTTAALIHRIQQQIEFMIHHLF